MTTDTLTPTAFLLARIAEDEVTTEAFEEGMYALGDDYPPTAEDLARLTRMERECEAKRRIVELHQGSGGWHECPSGGSLGGRYAPGPCPTLHILAAVYSDHPDYREEWRA